MLKSDPRRYSGIRSEEFVWRETLLKASNTRFVQEAAVPMIRGVTKRGIHCAIQLISKLETVSYVDRYSSNSFIDAKETNSMQPISEASLPDPQALIDPIQQVYPAALRKSLRDQAFAKTLYPC